MTICVAIVIQNGRPASVATTGSATTTNAVTAMVSLARDNREESAWSPDQDQRHEDVNRDRAQTGPEAFGRSRREQVGQRARNVGPAERVDGRDQEGRDERAADRTDAADDDDDERGDEHLLAHADGDREDRPDDRPGQARQ